MLYKYITGAVKPVASTENSNATADTQMHTTAALCSTFTHSQRKANHSVTRVTALCEHTPIRSNNANEVDIITISLHCITKTIKKTGTKDSRTGGREC
jgi:hypothetical protein